MRWAHYTDLGEIIAVYEAPTKEELSLTSGRVIAVDAGVSDDTHYIENERAKKKTALNAAYNVAGLEVVFASLPAGTQVEVSGSTLVTDNENTVIGFDVPGAYYFEFYPPVKYTMETLEVTVG